MANLGQYILSVTIAAMACGIAASLALSENSRKWIRLICGLLLMVTIIKPLSALRHVEFTIIDPINWVEGEAASAEGEKLSQDAMADIIKYQTEAYILDKASELGAAIHANVSVSDERIPVPIFVELTGTVSPYLQLKLEAIIQDNLGITKEKIQWRE